MRCARVRFRSGCSSAGRWDEGERGGGEEFPCIIMRNYPSRENLDDVGGGYREDGRENWGSLRTRAGNNFVRCFDGE